jgi:DNA-binding CsgD family transcriptional regulator
MLRNDDEWLSIIDTFFSAALDGNWDTPLERFAAATGSWSGELIGLGSASAVSFNWVTGIGPEWREDFVASGGADPNLNPYARAAFHIPELQVVQSGELLTRKDWRSNPFINFHISRYDIRHVCLTPLLKQSDGLMVGLAVMRSTRQGEITSQQRKVFATLSQHLRSAIRMQIALESKGAQLMAGTLEAVSLTAFVCDHAGVVRAITPAAEALVRHGDALRLRHGQLQALFAEDTHKISEAMTLGALSMHRPGAPPARSVIIRGRSAPLVLDILPLPKREFSFGFEPRVLVVIRNRPADHGHVKTLLRAAYGLTAAEADVALSLTAGQSPEAIAAARGTSIGTVRTQIRTLFMKLHVRRQSELIARVNQLR